jgi:hypothetical protein
LNNILAIESTILNCFLLFKKRNNMAYPNLVLVDVLRQTAKNLNEGAHYAWGNHGACNCGNLLQVVANVSKEEILTYAHTGFGEWTELAEEYCPVSNTPVNLMIKKLMDIGLTPSDIHHLEYLDDKSVLEKLPGGFKWLKRNVREDVALYFATFANQLEESYLNNICIPYPPKEVLEREYAG